MLGPAGQLIFMEHVAAQPGTSTHRWQRRLEPIWKRLAGGLPAGEIGRIGLDTFNGKDGTVVYACVENANKAKPAENTERTARGETA